MKTLKFLTNLVFIFSIMTTALIGCKDDDNVTVTPDVKIPDGEALQEKYAEHLNEASQTFQVDAESGGAVTGEKGTYLYFNANSMIDADGNDVTGNIDIELIELYDKAQMLLGDKPTRGRQEDGSIATLVSGGEFFINATQNGEQLQLKPGIGFQIVVETDSLDMDMQLFVNENGDCLEADCEVIWEEAKGRLEAGDAQGGNGDGGGAYYGFADNFGWTNIDRWYSDPRPKTTLYVDVPEGYDNTNCSVFLSYDGEPAALAKFDVYDEETGLFTEHYGQIPIGLEVHFIVLSVIDDQYYYAIQGATITEDHVELIGDLSPTTEAELIQMVEDLP
ncbi:hypothetical protein GCM10009122_09110 [Fulvivirga kasyanovii]|uniref:DUF4367 domain-containing protein n=1 Tax=Fulvivirga kasyanovii TaxID=396812 RepID=A0ABW9RYK8_9BACT|nr:hypothetical protein [Fulvivirga kasyanovii]MTI29083.1 hypothetical protein [Fulvivirga kasyanovii]